MLAYRFLPHTIKSIIRDFTEKDEREKLLSLQANNFSNQLMTAIYAVCLFYVLGNKLNGWTWPIPTEFIEFLFLIVGLGQLHIRLPLLYAAWKLQPLENEIPAENSEIKL